MGSRVTSIKGFLQWVERSSPEIFNGNSQDYFFRGHSKVAYTLEPSAYRADSQGKSYRASEFHLYQDMLRRSPSAFVGDNSVFERLVRMQHHGLPTRLLDVTQSSLVALYFACRSNEDCDGQVFSFGIPRADVIFGSVIPEQSIVGLEESLNFKKIVREPIDRVERQIKRIGKYKTKNNDLNHQSVSVMDIIVAEIEKYRHCDDILTISMLIDEIKKIYFDFFNGWKDKLNNVLEGSEDPGENVTIELIMHCQDRMNDFSDIMYDIVIGICKGARILKNIDNYDLVGFLKKFTHYCFVSPSLNNERINRQQGAFIIFPPIASPIYPFEKFYGSNYVKFSSVLIPKGSKNKLLGDLSNFGFSTSFLFPELENQAEDITKRYCASVYT